MADLFRIACAEDGKLQSQQSSIESPSPIETGEELVSQQEKCVQQQCESAARSGDIEEKKRAENMVAMFLINGMINYRTARRLRNLLAGQPAI